MSRPLITLTTDFGAGSPYMAQMKGVILSVARDVDLVDISHAIKPQNVREGAVVLADSTPRFPPGTIHIAVIDPGVGTGRRVVYAELGQQRYIAPDNGLLSLLAIQEGPKALGRIVSLENRQYWLPRPSHTFHGRDIMSPVAAHLALGVDPGQFGPARDELVMLEWSQVHRSAHRIVGEVMYIDSFGNLITNIDREDLAALGNPASLTIDLGDQKIHGLVRTYGAAMGGEVVGLFDAQGRLEVAVVEGNAAVTLQKNAGDMVVVSST
jgi:S-adenosylmethionine hydrolase